MTASLPDEPVFHDIELPVPLAGPPPEQPLRRASSGLDAITGGGLVALVDPTRGLHSLWAGTIRIAGPLRLRSGDRLLHPSSAIRMDGGGWERSVPLPGGSNLIERAVLLDSAPALILSWFPSDRATRTGGAWPARRVAPGPQIELELQPPGGGPPLRHPVATPGGVALMMGTSNPDRLAPLLRPPAARERARRRLRWTESTGDHDGLGVRIDRGLETFDLLLEARRALERSPLGTDAHGAPEGPFLLGVEEGRPRFAVGSALAEIGLGALLAGHSELGWSVLDTLLRDPDAPPLPILHLAASLGSWTGEIARLAALREGLDGASERLEPGGRAAAYPGPVRVLDALAGSVETMGGGWKERLKARRDALVEPGGGGSESDHRRARRPTLPVIGKGAPPTEAAPLLAAPPTLPQPESFAPVDDPGVTPRRTLHAARLVRAWVEGILGAEPDAAFGRLQLAPDLRSFDTPLQVRGIRLAGTRLGFDYRPGEGACRLRVFQESGRLPVNLIFAPRLSLVHPVTVRMGDEKVEIRVEELRDGVALACQFPLDPERRIAVEEEG